jgi:glycosyltransferase involved in cell wall biosynthesis
VKIDVVARDGSPLGVTMQTVRGEDPAQIGVGGAELAILTLCELWTKAGHAVRFYNNPRVIGASPFEQLVTSAFVPGEPRDVLIIFRSPNPCAEGANGLKIWFSTDQYTINSFRDFAPKVNKIVTISQFHAEYFKKTYGIENTIVIDLPVRTWEYENKGIVRIPKRCLFSSVPDRGLRELFDAWHRIVEAVPDANLVITSDYRLWGCGAPMNSQYVDMIPNLKNVFMRGAVPRSELVIEQLKAQLLSYPCTYEELFCYSVAEAECAGALPITTKIGALPTTNEGIKVEPGEFANAVITTLNAPIDWAAQSVFMGNMQKRFGPERILKEWDKVFAS